MCSQEVEFLVEATLLSDKVADNLRVLVVERGHGAVLLGVTNPGVQIGNLVGVHAGGRHLDGTSPVEVVVTEGKGQLLKLNLSQAGLIEGHVEVSWALAALGSLHWHEEKVEFWSVCAS